ARPDVPCWVVGPPDARGKPEASRHRVRLVTAQEELAAQDLGCGFCSAQELMGGEGSFVRWTEQRPALARGDGIHLTISGYRALGDALADALLPLPKKAAGVLAGSPVDAPPPAPGVVEQPTSLRPEAAGPPGAFRSAGPISPEVEAPVGMAGR